MDTLSPVNNISMETKQIFKIIGKSIFGLLVLITLFGSFTLVGAGQRGVLITMGKVEDRVLNEGFNVKVPFQADFAKSQST